MNGPVKGVQGENPQLRVVRGITSALQEELDKVGNVFAENGDFLWVQRHELGLRRTKDRFATYEDEESLQNVEEMPGTGLIAGGHGFMDDLEYGREEGADGGLNQDDKISSFTRQ